MVWVLVQSFAICAFCFCTAYWLMGVWLRRRYKKRADGGLKLKAESVETIEDVEGLLSYKIDIAKFTLPDVGDVWIWHAIVRRYGPSVVTGDMSMPGMVLVPTEGADPTDMVVEAEGSGPPVGSRDEAYACALRAVEAMR